MTEPNKQPRLPQKFVPLGLKQYLRYEKLGESIDTSYLLDSEGVLMIKGGTRQSFANDFDQARRIVQLFLQTDHMTNFATKETKKMLHRNRDQLISTLPATRVWLFVKFWRTISEQESPITRNPFEQPMDSEGGEDVFADGSWRCLTPRYLSHTY